MMDREEMLEQLWKTVDPSRHLLHSFGDDTSCYFLKHMKFERDAKKYNLYNTTSDLYTPIPDSAVWYAHASSLDNLSMALMRTRAEHRVNHLKYQQTEETTIRLNEFIEQAKKENIPNLNQIKKDYESKQREDCQAV